MQITLGRKLFLYTSGVLLGLLLLIFPVLERGQARQWEEHLRSQHLAFARFATPEILKRFRGDFPEVPSAQVEALTHLLEFNRDLIRFSIHSPGGRLLFVSSPFSGFAELPPELGEETLVRQLAARRLTSQTLPLADGGRVLEVISPAFGPTGSQLLSVRYLFSFNSVDRRLAEMHNAFVTIALVAAGISLLLVALVARRVTRPIEQLTAAVRAIGRGELRTSIRSRGSDEIASLALAFNEMAASLAGNQDELTTKNDQLLQANEELRKIHERLIRAERLAAVGQLAAGVSHEIDNPVGIILGYAELLLEDLPEDDQRAEDVRAIIDECIRCRKITGGLLGLARTGAQQWEAVSLSQLVTETMNSLRPQKLFRRIVLEPRLAEQLPMVVGDADRLRQVLVNLLLNAAQAVGEEGRIEVCLLQRDDEALIEVHDDGPGISAAQLEQIFEPFFSTKEKGEGTGLGLSVCRKLVEEHGGSIEAAASALGGALLRIRLPLDNEAAEV